MLDPRHLQLFAVESRIRFADLAKTDFDWAIDSEPATAAVDLSTADHSIVVDLSIVVGIEVVA
jgi:hypothetical protein